MREHVENAEQVPSPVAVYLFFGVIGINLCASLILWGPQLACDIIDLSTSFIIIQHLSKLVAGTWMCSHLATREGCGLYWQIAKVGLR